MDNGVSSYYRFLDGDESGFVEIIRDYKDGLIFYLNGFVCDLYIAEELVEDTFVKIVIRKPRLSGKSSFKTWLYTIGRNVAVDYLKKRSKQKEFPIDEIREMTDEEAIFENKFLREERKITVHRAMCRLKPEYRQVLWLTYFEDFSNKETATVMKKKVHNIETLVSRARQALKEELEKEDFVYEEL
ncbi:MAG: RNA polymerase sigma factor [Clostridia bacterium]|nr:RNA polymerase sigma factor [Clostridia bacterium]